jgi:DnaA regulatory inactivator Hda
LNSRQLTFDLGYRPALERQDFVVAPCNTDAVAWLDRWPDWTSPGLVLVGPAGSGKSHLLASFASAHDGVVLKASDVSVSSLPEQIGAARLVLIDDLGTAQDLSALFHLYNWSVQHGLSMVFASDRPAARLDFGLADLSSRLKALPHVEISPPDDQVLMMVLAKQFADRQITVTQDVLTYLVGRIERSFASVRAAVDAMDRASLSESRAVTIPLIKRTLFM